MREIKFRGKRLDNGEWVYGDLIHSRTAHQMWINTHNAECAGHTFIQPSEIDPATVGQYTGLKDKNGREIYEGDIVDCWSEGVNAQGKVQQRKDGLWIIYPAWQKRIMWGLCPSENGSTTVEVIGNAMDNPTLLEGREE